MADEKLRNYERLANQAGSFESAPVEWLHFAQVLQQYNRLDEARNVYQNIFYHHPDNEVARNFIKGDDLSGILQTLDDKDVHATWLFTDHLRQRGLSINQKGEYDGGDEIYLNIACSEQKEDEVFGDFNQQPPYHVGDLAVDQRVIFEYSRVYTARAHDGIFSCEVHTPEEGLAGRMSEDRLHWPDISDRRIKDYLSMVDAYFVELTPEVITAVRRATNAGYMEDEEYQELIRVIGSFARETPLDIQQQHFIPLNKIPEEK
jgi:hypothetical protein